jgi:hypothetical protein
MCQDGACTESAQIAIVLCYCCDATRAGYVYVSVQGTNVRIAQSDIKNAKRCTLLLALRESTVGNKLQSIAAL